MNKRVYIVIGILIIIGALVYSFGLKDKYASETFYATDNESIVFSEDLNKGDKILFYFDVKVLEGAQSHIVLYDPSGEVMSWDKPRKPAKGNNGKSTGKGAYTVKEDGIHEMKIFFSDNSLNRQSAEVEVDWRFERK